MTSKFLKKRVRRAALLRWMLQVDKVDNSFSSSSTRQVAAKTANRPAKQTMQLFDAWTEQPSFACKEQWTAHLKRPRKVHGLKIRVQVFVLFLITNRDNFL